ncbi:Uncharacterized protein ESCO_006805 [Escovopsis weberi]|uniref:Nudix hydrolase domain-containing protein n=1 Tax=Escovopsis weberi TaxID=150374 RepID=A0A0M9VV63_ESCWE|nr:Uncharacterized protein ESCO_006805 [Escovopsis weberi]
MSATKLKSNLDLICDTDRLPQDVFTLLWTDEDGPYAIGYVLKRVARELDQAPAELRAGIVIDYDNRTIRLCLGDSTEVERTQMMANLAKYWRDRATFKLLKTWRNELWPVYDRRGGLLFSMERAAVGLIGAMRYGVHMTAYVEDKTAPHGIRLWIPKRAADKSTYPSMLDNTVAGGLMTGEDPFECIIREADEEASLPEDVVRNNAVCTGTVTYIDVTEARHVGEDDYIYPECEWVYDLKLPADVVPQPKDGEVEEFRLCDVDEVKRDLRLGKFKSNCALVTIDFFIRHGILTEENEPDLARLGKISGKP